MVTDTYVGEVKSEKFDFDIDCPEKYNTGYTPKPIFYLPDFNKAIYFSIVSDVDDKKENTKRTDWGCFVVKLTKEDLLKRLPASIYDSIKAGVEKLEAGKEYLLVAEEIM